MEDESKNSVDDDEDDENCVEKGMNKKDQEECKTCGKKDHGKNTACKRFTKKREHKGQAKLNQKEEK